MQNLNIANEDNALQASSSTQEVSLQWLFFGDSYFVTNLLGQVLSTAGQLADPINSMNGDGNSYTSSP